MASSSSSSRSKHDVFLSFRGKDTRNNFTGHLYKALKRRGIGAYTDFDGLKKGEELSPALSKAIEESRASLVVFSENYASSSWCLEELSTIMKCQQERNQIVVPIFYGAVDPSDIRKQTGSFGKALAKHEKRWPPDRVQRWRAALTEAGNLSGWPLVGDRPEPEMIEKIVTSLSETLNRMYPIYFKNQDLVGIGPRVEKIKRLLCLNRQEQDNLTLGIWGMAGIGKTTLAKAISNEVSTQFEACCFLGNVSDELKKPGGTASLQDKLLSKILEEKSLHTDGWGSAFSSNRIRNKKVLLVLDDVDELEQLETLALLGRDAFAPGSIVIITSTDKQVLRNRVDEIYEVEALNYEESLQLFCLGAFKQNSPSDDFSDLADRFVGYARGNPLALKVLGPALYGQSKEYWESALRKLQESPDSKILDALKISYDTLDRVGKDIFLDIACFFKGWNAKDVMKLCDSSFYGKAHCAVINLIDRCLLNNITKEGNICMHDLLHEMAWDIVRQESNEPGKRSRLWNLRDVDHVLRNNTGTPSIRGISLDMSQSSLLQLPGNSFSRLQNLRILRIRNSGRARKLQISGEKSLEYLPSTLRYLHWEGYPSESLPLDFNPEHLDTLALPNSDIKKLWHGVKNLPKLRLLNLRDCKSLRKIPDLSLAPNLEMLDISYCSSLHHELPSLSSFPSLERLEIHGCLNLKKFPEVPLHITTLNLSGTSVEEIPKSVMELECLEYLSLSGCPLTNFPENLPRSIKSLYLDQTNILAVPSSIGSFSELSKLHMSGCERLKTIPTSLCRLKHLEYLDFSNCSRLDSFPEILEPMETLWKLDLSGTALKGLPPSLSFLVGLMELRLNDCRNLTSLPNNLCSLTSLRLLYVQNCPNLVYVPDIKSLWRLYADETALLQLPSSAGHLEELSLSRCKDLKLGLFSGLTSVSNLCLRDSNISEITEHLGKLTNLSRLDLSKNEFTRIPTTIRRLPNLAELLLISCKRLRSVPILPPGLKILDAHNCTSLESVAQQPHCKPDDEDGSCSYIFSNCFNLDQNSYNKIVAHAQLKFQRMAAPLVEAYQHCKKINGAASVFCLPGSDILGWFNHKRIGSSITVKLPSGWSKRSFSGFALCIVVDFKDYEDHCQSRNGFEQCPAVGSLHPTIICRVRFKTKHGDNHNEQYHNFSCKWKIGNDDEPRHIRHDHVLFLYHNYIYRSVVHHMVDEDNGNEVSFEFFEENLRCKVKKCGVRLLYALVEVAAEVTREVTHVEDDDVNQDINSEDEEHESSNDGNDEDHESGSDEGESGSGSDDALHDSSDDDYQSSHHSQDMDEPKVDAFTLDARHVGMRLASSSPGAGCSIGVASPATSPPLVSFVDQFATPGGFHGFPVQPIHVAPLREAEFMGGKFWESSFLCGKGVIATFLDLVGDLVLKAKAPSTLSLKDLEVMLTAYDDCVKVKFNLDFMHSTREQIHNVIEGMKHDPEAESAKLTEELKAIDAHKKELKATWSKLQKKRASLCAKQKGLEPIRNSLEAFHQGCSFFQSP